MKNNGFEKTMANVTAELEGAGISFVIVATPSKPVLAKVWAYTDGIPELVAEMAYVLMHNRDFGIDMIYVLEGVLKKLESTVNVQDDGTYTWG